MRFNVPTMLDYFVKLGTNKPKPKTKVKTCFFAYFKI